MTLLTTTYEHFFCHFFLLFLASLIFFKGLFLPFKEFHLPFFFFLSQCYSVPYASIPLAALPSVVVVEN